MTENFSLHIFKNMNIGSTKVTNIKLIYWLQGNGDIVINLQKYNVKRYDIALVTVNDLYQIKSSNNAICCILDIDMQFFLKFNMMSYDMTGQLISHKDRKVIKTLINYLISNHYIGNSIEVSNDKLLTYLCIELANLQLHVSNKSFVAEEVHSYLTTHHHKKINKKDLLSHISMSSKSLTEMFKHSPYNNFNQYVNQIRLNYCLIDILTSTAPIEKIASNHGFNHYSRFIHLFKETYGATPKLIRKRHQPSSYSEDKFQIIDINNNILKLLEEDNESKHLIKEIDVSNNNSKVHLDYNYPKILIDHDQWYWLDSHIINMINQQLKINKDKVHIIINLELIDENQDLCQLIDKITYLRSNIIFKIQHRYEGILTSKERHKLEKIMIAIFNSTFENRGLTISFLVERLTHTAINKLKRMINNYIECYEVIYQMTDWDSSNDHPQQFYEDINQFILKVDNIEQFKGTISKVILDVSSFALMTENKVTDDIMVHMSSIMKYCQKLSGFKIVAPNTNQTVVKSQLSPHTIMQFIITKFNQLRGNVIFKNDTMIVTRFKHELQCVICLPITMYSSDIDYIQFKYIGLEKIHHANMTQIVFNPYVPFVHNQNSAMINAIINQPQCWQAHYVDKYINDSTIVIPGYSIIHVKYHLKI
ncbi:helix-turn-helix transcriptional regulator [Staphylococcus simiae]|uniref:Transcriptional regulator n=1 Tax=Staphylococcus simiae CCM 7213 = CCUG 51256 TaxID=911238 RepID=G5JFQ9_9STAP|nr:AraC family transcriptional regulator [Staphylococcus simiae]EHJ09049.1 transcriptional regulator [Staphylococcus simiae CCM 7213 = CCUG 51256]PNZ08947.1 AraC family transcriptional regulator [Staphylococcus simiae]SNV79417.1 Transcription regulator [Staphylococcus simiae]